MNVFEEAATGEQISGPPSQNDYLLDRSFRGISSICAWLILAIVGLLVGIIGIKAIPAISEYHLGFLTGTTWDVNKQVFGILPEIWGTLYSSILALVIGGFFGVTMAIFLTQDFLHSKLAMVFRTIVELLAAIPSVVYGFWGIFVVIPFIRPIAEWLNAEFSWIPFFSTTLSGPGMLPAALVLAIMILPTIAAVSQDAIRQVPYRTKEAAFGLGATRWEAILKVILPTASTGIFGALVLGFGRALGETMALAMLVGNSNQLSLSLFSPGNTLAALLALNFPEAGDREVPVLMYAALVLLLITLAVNIIGTTIMSLTSSQPKAGK
jgi:phosphate transport system permease protein